MPRFNLIVNDEERVVDVDADTPLLWVLRDELGLTGAKFGCGLGLCRTCTVHVDGAASMSCLLPVTAVAGKRITTIENLAGDDALHPLQQAWIAEQVPQCGYCQPGQLLTAAELLAVHPEPTDEQIDQWMSPVLCRCGTYGRIRAAIHRAAREISHAA